LEILKTHLEVKNRLNQETLGAVHLLRLNGYGSINFKCSCGHEHDLNGKDIKQLASAKSFKVLLKCQDDYYTMVKIEGFFRKRTISEYGFHQSHRE
jgi:hypothetical protein